MSIAAQTIVTFVVSLPKADTRLIDNFSAKLGNFTKLGSTKVSDRPGSVFSQSSLPCPRIDYHVSAKRGDTGLWYCYYNLIVSYLQQNQNWDESVRLPSLLFHRRPPIECDWNISTNTILHMLTVNAINRGALTAICAALNLILVSSSCWCVLPETANA